ncbi:MAG TPA: bifunctional 5,10-methylenetetrahydrofolate dehydrogenase/5,10-methenyltetrahydrofolate cyclohydrolase [Actinomycetota bacterium]
MAARIIDGKAIAAQVRAEIAERVAASGITPGFVDLLIGDDPASEQYVGMKNKAAEAAGMAWFDRRLPADVDEATILLTIRDMNQDPLIHGILVQLPLPKECPADPFEVVAAIDPAKDVDGLNPMSQGLLAVGRPNFVPATPLGVVELLERSQIPVEGRHVVVIGRSLLLGRPLSILLSLKAPGLNATVTLCHTGTKDIGEHTRRADIIVAAAGSAGSVTADMVKPGAVVIDCGTNKLSDGRTVGDVDFHAVSEIAGAITPVPGGVGPMTVAMLMVNVARAAGV